MRGAVAHSSLGCAQGVSLTTARERGQLVFLEGLRSAVDTFFRAEGEARPLQFLRSVRLQPGPRAQLVGASPALLLPPPRCVGGQSGFGSDTSLLWRHSWKPLL